MDISRRGLLRGTSAVGVGLLVDSVAIVAHATSTQSHVDLHGARHNAGRVDLPGDDKHTQQGFCFTLGRHDEMFVTQPHQTERSGDLRVFRFRVDSGRLVYKDHMTLLGFGHGESIGAYRHNDQPYLWVEADSVARKHETNGTTVWKGEGTHFACVRWRPSATVRSSQKAKGVTIFRQHTYETVSPGIDPSNRRLILHYKSLEGHRRMTTYPLDKFHPGDHTYLPTGTTYATPAKPKGALPQGWTVLGDYLYTLEGHGRTNDSYIRAYDMTNQPMNQVDLRHFTFTSGWAYHEPEGITVRKTGSGSYQLWFGVSSLSSDGQHPSHFSYL